MIMMVGLVTTAVWALSTVIMIAIVVQTIRLTIRLKRIRKYLDIKSNDTKQEDHDAKILERKKRGRDYPHPNPSRNYFQLTALNSKVTQMKEDARQRGANITRLNQHVALLESKEDNPSTIEKTERLRQSRRPRD